jgi:hypothetical protein
MTYQNARALLAALGVYFLSQIVIAGAPVIDSSTSSAFTTLPAPTGPFAVGKITAHWTDESRIEPLSPNHEPRELMVDIWYPAEPSNGVPVAYLDTAAYQRALGDDGFRNQFGNASETIKEGVRTHAVAGAPYSLSAGPSPVLIFSPGGGMVREVYAAQLEDLASHGYVVAAISHPYDAIVTSFPDGRQIAYSSQRWPKPPSLEGEANLMSSKWQRRRASHIRAAQLIQNVARLDAYQDTALRSTGKGGYRIRLRNNITTHMDFSDLPALGAHDRVDAERRAAILAVVRSYTLAFFDKCLRGVKPELLDETATGEFVEAVQKFAPAKSPCASQ